MDRWICYEEGCEGIFTLAALKRMWKTRICQDNFSDFESWLAEMERFGILNKF